MTQQPQLYDVYFTGKLIDNISAEQAQLSVAKLFKTSPEKIAHLFNGKTHVLKRQLSKEDALKYKNVLRKAGLSILFKISEDSNTASSSAAPAATAESAPAEPSSQATGLSMAPVGSDVLSASERRTFVPANIDTSDIQLLSPFDQQETATTPSATAPDTSHISVAGVGEDLNPNRPASPAPLDLNLDDISLAPAGALLEELHEEIPLVDPDISAMSMAPVGADLLEGQVHKSPPPPPDTSHLSVE